MPRTSPESFGPWRVVAPAGRGAHGVVYRAVHEERGTLAAVKVLASLGSKDRGRVARELRMLERASHPDIVQLLDHRVEAEEPWLAMRWVAGPSLERWIFDRPLSSDEVRERLDLVVRLCTPLSWLHGEGRVHRDLKPANVHVEQGRPVLLDLGIAAIDRGLDGREAAVAAAAAASGTWAYMAPEQGRGEVVDARADLYALGCLLWTLLVGRPPYRRPPAIERPPPSIVDRDPSLGALQPVLSRLLCGSPLGRYGHADEVARDLVALGARPDTAVRPVARPVLFRPPAVGRQEVLDRIMELRHGAVLVRGPSGIGRTRVILEAVTRARRVRRSVRAHDARPLADVRDAIAGVAVDGPPEMLLLDDVHRLPDELITALDRVVRQGLPPGRVLVLTSRDDPLPAKVQRWIADEVVDDIVLGPLAPEDVGQMIRHALAHPHAPEMFGPRVHARTGGHPWFVDAWLRGAVASGWLFRDGHGVWRLGDADPFAEAELSAGPIPAAIRASLAARVDALPDDAVTFLVAGAFLGPRFRPADAAAVCGLSDWTEAAVESLRTAIVAERDGVMHFGHQLWVDLLRERVGPEVADEWAARGACRLADWGEDPLREGGLHERSNSQKLAVEAYIRATAIDDPEAVVEAWEGIGRCSDDIGVQVDAWFQAARVLLDLLREPEAIAHLERAAGLARTAHERIDAVGALANIANVERRLDDSLALLEPLVAELGEASPAWLLFQLGSTQRYLGRPEDCERTFRRCLEVSEADGDAYHAGLAEAGLGLLALRDLRLDEAEVYLERTRDRDYSTETAQRAASVRDVAFGNLAVVHHERGDSEAAARGLAVAEDHAVAFGMTASASRHAGNRGILLLEDGRLDESIAALGAAVRINRSMGRAYWENAFLGCWLRACRLRGDPVQALAPSVERLRWLLRHATGVASMVGWVELAHMAWYAGEDGSEALSHARAAVGPLVPALGGHLDRLARAERTAERVAAGLPLVGGECPEDLPQRLR